MKTNQIAILAALGLGAYFLMTRNAQAAPVSTAKQSAYAKRQGFPVNTTSASQRQAMQAQEAGGLIAQGIGAVRQIFGMIGGAGGTPNANSGTEIANSALPGQEGYGWRYFSDGTAIDPNGSYYTGGQAVWSPQIDNTDSVAVNPANLYATTLEA